MLYGYKEENPAVRVVKATKMEPIAWEYNWVTLSLENIYRTFPPYWGLEARLTTLLRKKILLRNPRKRKLDGLIQDIQQIFKEEYGCKRTVMLIDIVKEKRTGVGTTGDADVTTTKLSL
jgi:hypothetical protein